MHSSRHRVATVGVAVVLGLGSGLVAAQTASAAPTDSVALAGSVAPAAVRGRPAADVAASAQVKFDMVMRLRDAAGAQALLQSVSSPGSPNYRHYLTAAQWESRFSPSASDISTVRSWLAGQGFGVGTVSGDRLTISASGTAAQVDKAFGTSLADYRVNGQLVRMASTQVSIPASLSNIVAGPMGFTQSIAEPAIAAATPASAPPAQVGSPLPAPPPARLATLSPCGTYFGQSTTTLSPAFGQGFPSTVPDSVCGYTPPQLRSAYNIGSSGTGKGETVAVVGAYDSATIDSDATQYFENEDSNNPFSKTDFTQYDASTFDDQSECGPSTWEVEQALDVEAVHAVAPDAHIIYAGGADCDTSTGLFDANQLVVDNGLANVVTNSWNDEGGDVTDDAMTRSAFDDLYMMAGSMGISVTYSSGDRSDELTDVGFSAANYPASSPYVTAVGGTTLEIGSKGQQTGQIGYSVGTSELCTTSLEGELGGCTASTANTWLPTVYSAGGGGYTSASYAQPSYQAGVVPTALSERLSQTPARVVPDIAMDADPSTGMLIGLTQTNADGSVSYGQPTFGGTSLAAPLMAGTIADADQVASHNGYGQIGFVNPALYQLAGKRGAIQDIVPPTSPLGILSTRFVSGTSGPTFQTLRQGNYQGTETFCDSNGTCTTQQVPLSAATGYDSMTGLGSIGSSFVSDLAQQ